MERLPIQDAELGTLARMMRSSEFFSPLTIAQLERVLPHVMLCSFKAGETVFRQGDAGDAFHIVRSGKVEVRLRRLAVLSKTVATLGPGQFFGEIALISSEPRTATVVCVEPTRLFTLMGVDFAFVVNENPAAAQQMRAVAAARRFASKHAS